MRRHRLSRPDRAGFIGRVVADGENEIHLGGAGNREFLPVLRTSEGRVVVEGFQKLERERMDLSFRVRSGRISLEPAGSDTIENRLGKDRPCRIAGAEKKNFIWLTHRASSFNIRK
jgi:hypothetical protein